MTTALVFPALGPVRRNELGKFLLIDPAGRRRLAEADEALGYRLADALADAGDDDYAAPVQVAFAVACLALAERLDVAPQLCVGPSFGERTALIHAGALPFADGVRLIAEVARIEADYFTDSYPDVVTHSFTRVPPDRLAELLAALPGWHEVSARLDPDFHMVSLTEADLPGFIAAIGAGGGYSMYSMRPPAHACVFTALRDRVAAAALRYDLCDPRIPIVCQDGRVVADADAVRTALADGFVSPIAWPDTVATLAGRGIRRIVIAGPDNLFHRLRASRDTFTVQRYDLRQALRPRSLTRTAG